ncbi:MAG: hypothetical protein KC543_10460 [Myxococcales bacterium]|nr:hypothetical protein [Myxococcales bacterium]
MPKVAERLFDKRVVERNIAKGLVTPEAVSAHLGALPDVEDNTETVRVYVDAALGSDEPAAEQGAGPRGEHAPDEGSTTAPAHEG